MIRVGTDAVLKMTVRSPTLAVAVAQLLVQVPTELQSVQPCHWQCAAAVAQLEANRMPPELTCT